MSGIVSAARKTSAPRGGKDFGPSSKPGEAPILVVLCGPSHSGKTTFAQQLGEHFQVISSDAIRKRLTGRSGPSEREEEVWGTFEAVKRKALEEGRSLVLDACHMSREARWLRCKARTVATRGSASCLTFVARGGFVESAQGFGESVV